VSGTGGRWVLRSSIGGPENVFDAIPLLPLPLACFTFNLRRPRLKAARGE